MNSEVASPERGLQILKEVHSLVEEEAARAESLPREELQEERRREGPLAGCQSTSAEHVAEMYVLMGLDWYLGPDRRIWQDSQTHQQAMEAVIAKFNEMGQGGFFEEEPWVRTAFGGETMVEGREEKGYVDLLEAIDDWEALSEAHRKGKSPMGELAMLQAKYLAQYRNLGIALRY